MNIFKILKDDDKLNIILILINGERCVCDLEQMLGIKQSCLSNKLKVLKEANIISVRKQKNWHYYSLTSDFVLENKLLIEYITSKNENNFDVIKENCD